MGLRAHIEQILSEELEQSEYFLVGLKANESETSIQIYIDGPQGVGIKACSKLSRALASRMEEMELNTDNLKYEISSPGADKPLVDQRQYPQHIGRGLEIQMSDDSVISGKLEAVKEEEIELGVRKDKKKKETQTITVRFDQIKKAQVQISFK